MNASLIKMTLVTIATACVLSIGACSTAPKSSEGKSDLRSDAAAALTRAERNDPSLARLLNDAAGYAVFPTVGKGAVGVGGAYGKGVLYEGGRVVGYCDLSQGSIGLQLGGQSYTEIISFRTRDAVDRFKQGNLEFDAQATAVALKSGSAAKAAYENDVAVFTTDQAGLMFEASIGGQKFTYQPR